METYAAIKKEIWGSLGGPSVSGTLTFLVTAAQSGELTSRQTPCQLCCVDCFIRRSRFTDADVEAERLSHWSKVTQPVHGRSGN